MGQLEETMKSHDTVSRVLLLIFLFFGTFVYGYFETITPDFTLKFSGKFKPEMFYGKNVSLLNNNNEGNKIWFARHTLDLKTDILYGQESYGRTVAEMYFDIRSRGIWGNPDSIAATTDATTKIVDSVGRSHRH